MCLVARYLEAHSIPTVVLGSAMDIVKYCGAPRYVHVDFPLGNPAGRPYDLDMQREIAEQLLTFFEYATQDNSVLRLPYQWSEDEQWRDGYAAVTEANHAELQKKGEERRKQQEFAKVSGKSFLNRID